MVRENILKPADDLSSYRKTIEKYLPCVLIKCTKYTNSSRLAEIISLYALICSYQLAKILDGINEISVIMDNLVGVVGEDLTKWPGTPVNGQSSPTVLQGKTIRGGLRCAPLFKWENDLLFARRLAEMDMDDCYEELLRNGDFLAGFLDRDQYERIIESVIDNLIKINPPDAEKQSTFAPDRRLY